MNILPLLNRLLPKPKPKPRPAPRRPRAAPQVHWIRPALPDRHPEPGAGTPVAELQADDDEGPVCGWFDSSHALQHGLVVTEVDEPEAVAQLVPLGWWLGWQLTVAAAQTREAWPALRS